MSTAIEFLVNTASEAEIASHLSRCDTDFVPPLSDRVEIADYATKLASRAIRFEAWSGTTLIGLVAAYCNDQTRRIGYITSVSVLKEWSGRGISARLLNQCLEHADASGMRQVSLQVASDNASAIRLYEKSGFAAGDANGTFISMTRYFKS